MYLIIKLLSFMIAWAIFSITSTQAASWEEAIEAVERRAADYHRRATELGWPAHAGTMYNELDVEKHSCAILGRMLGLSKFIRHLEEDFPESSADGSEFRLAAISLGNWAHNARRLLHLDKPRQIKEWNLDCVGRMGISETAAFSDRDFASTFYDVEGETLRILGDVERGFAARLISAFQKNPQIKRVALGS